MIKSFKLTNQFTNSIAISLDVMFDMWQVNEKIGEHVGVKYKYYYLSYNDFQCIYYPYKFFTFNKIQILNPKFAINILQRRKIAKAIQKAIKDKEFNNG
jgi:hypothetical protein